MSEPKADPKARTVRLLPADADRVRTLDDSVGTDEAQRVARGEPELPAAQPGRYRIDGEHARGGLGVILRARDAVLERPIAIKELGDAASPRAGARFVREALITARLQHPGIVPVYDAGRWPGGAPYYAMKLVSGRTLGDEIAARGTLEDRLALVPNVLAVAEAIGYAHAEGVIHRDLKPDNIMIGAFGETVVLDWGLAKDRRVADDAAAEDGHYARAHADGTRLGAVLGTPAYMAPEQARGEQVDERADVWAIGAILYCLLAAEPPFDGPPDLVVQRVAIDSPPPLADRAPGAPPDLLAIVDKAMARDPAARYANAKLVAGDLSRFLTGQLVGARSYGRLALIARWLRRHRAAVAVAAILLAVLGATLVLSISRIVDERQVARARSDELLLTQARSQLERDPTATLAWLKQYPADGADQDAVRSAIADASARGIARHVWRGNPEYVHAIAVSPDGRLVATVSGPVLQLWDAQSGQRRARLTVSLAAELAFLGDGSALVVGGQDGSLIAVDAATFERHAIGKAAGDIVTIAGVPNARAIVTGDVSGAVQLWPLDGGAPRELTRHQGSVIFARVVADGVVASLGAADFVLRKVPLGGGPVTAETVVKVGDTDTASFSVSRNGVVEQVEGHDIGALAVSGDGRTVVVGLDDRVLRWTAGMAAPVELGRHHAPVKALAISDAGRIVSGAEDGSITSWIGGVAEALAGHEKALRTFAFAADGRLASGDVAGDVRIWSPSGSQLLRGHDLRIDHLAFGPDGTLYSAGDDGSVRAWPRRPAHQVIRVAGASVFRIAFLTPEAIVATSEDGTADLVSLAAGKSREIAAHPRQSYSIQRLSGGRFATASWDGTIDVFGPDGHALRRLDHGAEVNGLAASPDGSQLASTGVGGSVKLWNVDTGEARLVEQRTGDALDVAFSPDGRTLVTTGDDPPLHVIDLAAGAPPRVLRGHTDVARSPIFSRDGKTLYTAGGEGVVRAWDLASGTSRAFTGHEGRVRTIALSPDERYLASGGNDGAIIVWDLAHADRAIVLRGHAAEVRHVAFAPRGPLLASAGWDGTARLWNLDDGSETVWSADEDKVQQVAWSPDGTRLASAGTDGSVRVWSVGDRTAVPDDHLRLGRWLAASTSAAIDAAGALHLHVVTTPP